MKKTVFEEMGGTYIRQGDYLIPCLTLPEEEEQRFIVQIPMLLIYHLSG